MLIIPICAILAVIIGLNIACYMRDVRVSDFLMGYWRTLVIDNVVWLMTVLTAFVLGYCLSTITFNMMGQALRGTMFHLGG